MRIARDIVLRADAIRTGDRFADFLSLMSLAGTARACGERLEITLGRLGEAAEHPLHRIGNIGERRRFHGLRMEGGSEPRSTK